MTLKVDPGAAQQKVKDRYLFFARHEVRGRCSLFEDLALRIADDPELIAVISRLPENKRQPNLILASLRKLLGRVPTFNEVRAVIFDDLHRLTEVVLSHSTQTNEPGRCATLLPLLCQLRQPLALLELGASAGLCLIPDRYNYQYNSTFLRNDNSDPGLVLSCTIHGSVPIPDVMPEIVWRAGLDSNPLNVRNPDHRAWLETLIWPSEHDRLNRLRVAMDLAASEEMHLEQGDLHTADLDRLCAQASKDATPVIFHSAVLCYTLDQEARDAFVKRVGGLTDVWISNESPELYSAFGKDLIPARHDSNFLMALNGRPLAWTNPHGMSMTWIDSAPYATARGPQRHS